MPVINHLKNRDAQRRVLTVAIGRHKADGHLCYSYAEGDPHRIYGYNALGEGEWDGLEGAWASVDGESIGLTPEDYNFHPGAQATGMTTGPQTVDPWFEKDVPHSRTAAIGYRYPEGVGDPDTEANPPNIKVIARTKKVPNFNSSGAITDFSYSANPARAIVELANTYARMPNLPPIYTDYIDYWKRRIDWGALVDARDYYDSLETVDYRTIPDFEGFGLRASYFSDLTLTTLFAKRIEPVFDIQLGTGTPIYGLPADDFSARFEGFVKPKYTESYTLYITHDDGVRMWIDDVLVIDDWDSDPAEEHSAVVSLTANTFHEIKIEWYEETDAAVFKLEWESASQEREVIPQKYLYPAVEDQPREEIHWFTDNPLSFGESVNQILFLSNSIKQDVNGKLRFLPLDLLSPSFDFDSSNIIEGSFQFSTMDILRIDPVTLYEAQFNDLESQYLEEPTTPVTYKPEWLNSRSRENVKVVSMFNNTRWRALKILQTRAKLEVGRGVTASFDGVGALTYPPMPGDLVTVTHRKLGVGARTCLIREARDKAMREGSGLSTETTNRSFTVQEWSI